MEKLNAAAWIALVMVGTPFQNGRVLAKVEFRGAHYTARVIDNLDHIPRRRLGIETGRRRGKQPNINLNESWQRVRASAVGAWVPPRSD